VLRTLNFCLGALASNNAPETGELLARMRSLATSSPEDLTDEKYSSAINGLHSVLSPEHSDVLKSIIKRPVMLPDDLINLDSTGFDIIDGWAANLVRGELGLVAKG
jgi:hypothetical protein